MSKKCGKCSKTVYPTEELKCLDKVWHKACFKCQVCNMTLNMKNYKGYDKLPYCNAHYPQTKHTAVADTPESRRIAENTKIQSNREYHSDFEKQKGSYTAIPDNPELLRHLQNTKNTSLVQYHSEFERFKSSYTVIPDNPELQRHMLNTKNASLIKYHENFEKEKGKKMSVADDPETQRLKKNMQVVSNVAYHNTLQEKARMEQNRPNEETDNFAARRRGHKNPGSITDYVPTAVATPPQNQPTHVYNSKGEEQNHQSRRQIGSIADYDPIPNQILAAQPTGYQSVPSQQPRSPAMFAPTPYSPPGQFSSVQRQIGSVNFNPMPNSSPAPSSQYTSQPQARPGQGSMYTPFRPVQAPQPPKQNKGIVSQALYDYAAADTDEVSFMENDVIINCEPVDDGWMYGTVERTNKRGMLPSNYVQRLN